jgi:hypothetical protein
MRVIHFAPSDAHPAAWHAEPVCGDWGSMDTDWTDLAGGVTCEACRGVLRAGGSPAPSPGIAEGSGP